MISGILPGAMPRGVAIQLFFLCEESFVFLCGEEVGFVDIGDLDSNDELFIGILIEQFGGRIELLVDLDDFACNGSIDGGSCLYGFDGGVAIAQRKLIAHCRKLNINDGAERVLSVVGDAELCNAVFDQYPVMLTGVLASIGNHNIYLQGLSHLLVDMYNTDYFGITESFSMTGSFGIIT